MIISSRQISADKQHLDSSGMNVRQWVYEEEPLINEGDAEIPVTELHVKADLIDALRLKRLQEIHLQESLAEPDALEAKFRRGDKVYVNAEGMKWLDKEFKERYNGNVGTVLKSYHYEDYDDYGGNEIKCLVKWTNPVGPSDNISNWGENNLDLVQTRQADLKDKIKPRELKNGDRVRVKKTVDLGNLNHLYADNIGSVVDATGYSYDVNPQILVRWDNNVGLNKVLHHSNLNANSLELA